VVWIAALALLDAGTCSRNSDVCFIKCPTGFILPALLTHEGRSAAVGPLWLHEIKHDGFRIIARKDGHRVRLYSRPGNDLTPRFPLIVEAVSRLRARSIIIDGESVACDDNGIPNFNRLRYCHHDDSVLLCAFDLIELNGDDLRREPLVTRKATLASVVAKASPGILLNEHFEHDGPTVFAHACKLCLEGIVSKRISAHSKILSINRPRHIGTVELARNGLDSPERAPLTRRPCRCVNVLAHVLPALLNLRWPLRAACRPPAAIGFMRSSSIVSLLARRDGSRVLLFTRRGHDWSDRQPRNSRLRRDQGRSAPEGPPFLA
jgi:bifunctional non-homologous end joining protein LigD